jgi:hypothetical protein
VAQLVEALSFLPHYGLEVDTVSNKNEYQEYVLGSKGGRCFGPTNLTSSCADCLQIWQPQTPVPLSALPVLRFSLHKNAKKMRPVDKHGIYRGADKSLARPGRNQATATEDFEFNISYL